MVCRNSSRTITRALDSLVTQTCQDFKVIIKDALSTDDTLDIISSYKRFFGDRLTLLVGHDTGIYDAINICIRQIDKGHICLLHSDDELSPDTILNFHRITRYDDSDVFYGICRHVTASGSEQCLLRYSDNLLPTKSLVTLEHPATLISHLAYKKYGNYNQRYSIAADYELFLRFFLAGAKFTPLNTIVATHWSGGLSQTQRFKATKEMATVKKEYGIYTTIDMISVLLSTGLALSSRKLLAYLSKHLQ